MDTAGRVDRYGTQAAERGRMVLILHDEAESVISISGRNSRPVSWDVFRWLTPAQRRRLRKKHGSRKTHAHQQDAEGNKVRCPRCTRLKTVKTPLHGGPTWRAQ